MMVKSSKQIGKPLAELLEGIVSLGDHEQRSILGLALDSRLVEPGDCFFATAGTKLHGLSFIDAVVQRGAVAVLYDGGSEFEAAYIQRLRQKTSIPMIYVADLKKRVGEIASRFWNHPSNKLNIIGITGTNGKTSVSHFIAQAFAQLDCSAAVLGTLGNGVLGQLQSTSNTTPDAVSLQQFFAQMVASEVSWVAMEVSSHSLDQYRVEGTHFTCALWTNLTQDHLDYHGDLASYGRAKARLFLEHRPDVAILNVDDAYARNLLVQVTAPLLLYGVGVATEETAKIYNAHYVQASHWQTNLDGILLELHSSWGDAQVQSHLLGSFNVHNLLAVLAVLLQAGITLAAAVQAVEKIKPVAGRMEIVRAINKPTALVDYAHTPDALRQVLESVRSHVSGKIWCVFGCGGDRDRGKRPLMGKIAQLLADHVVLTNDNPRTESADAILQEILAGMDRTEQVRIEPDRKQAILTTLAQAAPEDWIVVAGKGHEEVQIIGTVAHPFSDRQLLADWMEGRIQ